MKKLALLALALGSLTVACTPPTNISISPTGSDNGGNGGNGGDGAGGAGGAGGAPNGGAGVGGEVQADTAHDVYVKEVHPSLIATCGGCHNPDGQVGAPAFLDYDAELSYPLTKAYPGVLTQPVDSLLITKLPHEGPALSDTQKETVGKWLSMELNEGGGDPVTSSSSGGNTGGPETLETMLADFANCMDYDIWVGSGMDEFPLQQTNGDGPCMSCHATGAGAVWLSGDSLETFDKSRMFPYVMRLVTPVYEGSTPVDLAPSTRFINKGKEPCQNPPICHPKFDLTPANKAALESFVGTTLAKWEAGTCPKP